MTSTDKVDICIIQEPYINFLHLTGTTPHWTVLYPTGHSKHPSKKRTITLISDKISIYNIYLDGNHSDTLAPMTESIHTRKRVSAHTETAHLMIAGDFNCHHPLWDKDRNHHLFTPLNLQKAQMILNLQSQLELMQVLPKGILTLVASNSGNHTRPDNVFISHTLIQRITTCTVLPECRPAKTDHIPILTTMDTTVARTAANT